VRNHTTTIAIGHAETERPCSDRQGGEEVQPAAQLRSYVNTIVVGTELTADFWTIRSIAAGYRTTPLPTNLERTPWNLESAVYVR
jgi:hypothetical protein